MESLNENEKLYSAQMDFMINIWMNNTIDLIIENVKKSIQDRKESAISHGLNYVDGPVHDYLYDGLGCEEYIAQRYDTFMDDYLLKKHGHHNSELIDILAIDDSLEAKKRRMSDSQIKELEREQMWWHFAYDASALCITRREFNRIDVEGILRDIDDAKPILECVKKYAEREYSSTLFGITLLLENPEKIVYLVKLADDGKPGKKGLFKKSPDEPPRLNAGGEYFMNKLKEKYIKRFIVDTSKEDIEFFCHIENSIFYQNQRMKERDYRISTVEENGINCIPEIKLNFKYSF